MAVFPDRPKALRQPGSSGPLRPGAVTPSQAPPLHPILQLQRLTGNRAVQRLMTVNAPGDAYEREADRVADAVTKMPESMPENVPVPAGSAAGGIQRKCAACEAGGETCPDCEKEELRRKPSEAAAFDESGAVSPDAADRVERLRSGGGRPLPAEDRAFFEPRLGHDLGGVRIHTDAIAAESARELRAQAYTTGSDVVFAAGHYAPHTSQGRQLLAHELVHVVQQGGAAAAGVARAIQRQPEGATFLPSRAGTAGPSGVPAEKWSETIEHQYRKRGDHFRADAVRDCRIQAACGKLMTVDEAYRLFQLAQSSGGDQAKIEQGVMMGSAAPLLYPQSPPPAPAPRPPRPTHLRSVPLQPSAPVAPAPPAPVAPAPPVTTPGPAPGPGTGVRPTPGPGTGARPGPGTGAGPAIVVTIMVLAVSELWSFAQFQEALRAQGYVILENPLAICIGGCHLPSQPQMPSSPPFSNLPRIPLGPDSLTPKEMDDLTKWIEGTRKAPQPAPTQQTQPQPTPQPQPQPAPRRRPNQTCENDVLDTLQAEKDRICNSIPGDSCSPKRVSPKRLARRPCSEIRQRIRAIQDCIAIRQVIQRDCFDNKPDKDHQKAFDDLASALRHCLTLEAQNCAPGHPMAGL